MTLWWKDVWCPYCGAPPGSHCVSKNGKPVAVHADRHRDGAYAVFEGYDEYDEEEVVAPPRYRTMITVYLPGDAPVSS